MNQTFDLILPQGFLEQHGLEQQGFTHNSHFQSVSQNIFLKFLYSLFEPHNMNFTQHDFFLDTKGVLFKDLIRKLRKTEE